MEERALPILPADDLRVAKQFYVDKLGFQVLFEASDDGISGVMGLRRGGIEITIDAPMPGHGRDACVAFEVSDADKLYEEWSAQVSIPSTPKDEDWNARTFEVFDPSGNTLFVIGPARKGG